MCGFIGVYGPDGVDVSPELYEGLLAIQHRGQDAAGIITFVRALAERVPHGQLVRPEDVFAAVKEVHAKVKGAYSVVALLPDVGMLAFRDPFGIKPMVMGKKETVEIKAAGSLHANGAHFTMADGSVRFQRPALNIQSVGDESEAFYLRVYGVGEYCYHGADLGILMTRGRMQSPKRELLERAKKSPLPPYYETPPAVARRRKSRSSSMARRRACSSASTRTTATARSTASASTLAAIRTSIGPEGSFA